MLRASGSCFFNCENNENREAYDLYLDTNEIRLWFSSHFSASHILNYSLWFTRVGFPYAAKLTNLNWDLLKVSICWHPQFSTQKDWILYRLSFYISLLYKKGRSMLLRGTHVISQIVIDCDMYHFSTLFICKTRIILWMCWVFFFTIFC